MKELVKLAFIMGLSVLSSLYYGWALMVLWGWFFVQGAGLATMPYVFWVGIPFIWDQLRISGLEKPKNKSDSDDDDGIATYIFWTIIKVLASLFGLGLAGIVFLLLV